MIEVFKTNVSKRVEAQMLIDTIQSAFGNYTVNFDLEDCDHILRVKSERDAIEVSRLVGLLRRLGFEAEVLPDGVPSPNATDILN
jgi:hypothetical protein